MPIHGPHIIKIQERAKQLLMAVVITTFTKGNTLPRNSALLIDHEGKLVLCYDKVHTCDFSDEAMLEGGECFYVGRIQYVMIGIMICYDREYPESARELMLQGAEIIVVPNDCTAMKNRLCALQTRAYENMVGVVMANPPGNNAGCSCAYSPIAWDDDGVSCDMKVMMGDEQSETLYYVTYDMDAIRHYRQHEMMGNTFRKPHAYTTLLNETIMEPFKR